MGLLVAHLEAADAYSLFRLKEKLKKRYEHDRDGYEQTGQNRKRQQIVRLTGVHFGIVWKAGPE